MAIPFQLAVGVAQASSLPRKSSDARVDRAKARIEELERSLQDVRNASASIRQIYLPDLGAVDRCTSCHVGIAEAETVASQPPFSPHPGQFLSLAAHPPESVGCTACHAGQGRATSSVEKAHGRVEHWEKPLLALAHTSASCLKRHGESSGALRGASKAGGGHGAIPPLRLLRLPPGRRV